MAMLPLLASTSPVPATKEAKGGVAGVRAGGGTGGGRRVPPARLPDPPDFLPARLLEPLRREVDRWVDGGHRRESIAHCMEGRVEAPPLADAFLLFLIVFTVPLLDELATRFLSK